MSHFNAYTEDLFHWENDLESDSERYLLMNTRSSFLAVFRNPELALEERIFSYLERYATFNFKIDYEAGKIYFSRGEEQNIKISRGEEYIFILCIFMALCELVIDGHEAYSWVKYIYIDDPISSLDDNNAIAVAVALATLFKKGKDRIKVIVSSHHSLFFNVMWNEFRSSGMKYKTYFLHRAGGEEVYTLRATDETPFFHHVAMLSELRTAVETNRIYTHHFNMLRCILEKTAVFFGFKEFSACIHGFEDEVLHSRALNLLSHDKYSLFEPREMLEDTRELFKQILRNFLQRYEFALPEIIAGSSEQAEQTE